MQPFLVAFIIEYLIYQSPESPDAVFLNSTINLSSPSLVISIIDVVTFSMLDTLFVENV